MVNAEGVVVDGDL